MTKEAYRVVVQKAAENKNEIILDLISQMLFESEQAKQELRNKGYGWTGLSLLETVKQEVPNSIKKVKTFRSDCLNHNVSNAPKGTDYESNISKDPDYCNRKFTQKIQEKLVMSFEEFDCPRMEGNTRFGKAHWELRGKYHCCSHCGSMHPDQAIQAIKDLGVGIIDPSDKKYKYYIALPGVKNAGDGPIKFYIQHFTEVQRINYNAAVKTSKSKKDSK